MFEAYKIGVKIGVIDATGGSILKIAAQFTKAQREASGFLKTLKSINAELGKAGRGWASSAADDFDRATASARRYENAARRAQAANGPTVGRIGSSSPFLLAAAVGGGGRSGGGGGPLLLTGPRADRGPLLLGGPSGGGGGLLPPGIAGMTGSNNPLYRAGRGAIARGGFGWGGGGRGGGGGGSAAAGGGNWASRMAAGAVIFEGGEAMLGALHAPVEQASAYQQAQARFKQFGLTDQQNAIAFTLSKNLKAPGTSYTDAMDAITEAQGVFRESGLNGADALRGAQMAAPLLAKMSFAAGSLDDQTQARMHTQELAALRFAEMRGGLKSPEAFNGIMNNAWKAIRSSGGNVDFEQYRQFMARGGVSAQGLTDRALYGELEPIIGELKGSTAGNALMTSYNRLTGAVRIPNQVAHMLADSGIWDASKVIWNRNGGIKSFKGNPLKEMSLMSSDPVQFYEKVIKPMYDKKGITSQADIARENTMLFGRTGGALYTLVNRQYQQTQMSADSQGKTKGIDAAVGDAEHTYAGNMKNFTAAWHNFQISFGNAALPMLTKGLQILTPVLSQAAKFLGAHSSIATGLVVVMGAIGGLALLAGPVIAIGGAFGAIAAVVGGGLAVTLAGVAAGIIAIAGAAATAYEWSKKHLTGTAIGDDIGSGVAHTLALFGNKTAQEAIANNNKASALLSGPAYGNPAGAQATHLTVVSKLDGRTVAKNTVTHISNAMTGPQTGMSPPDTSQFPMPSGYGTGN